MTQNLVPLDLTAEALAVLDQALTTIEEIVEPCITPPTDEVRRDFALFDALRPRLLRLRELLAKAEGSTTALGSDILVPVLEGYALMQMFGKGEGLESLRKAMLGRSSPGDGRQAAHPQWPAPRGGWPTAPCPSR